MKKVWIASLFLLALIFLGGYFAFKNSEDEIYLDPIHGETKELERTYQNYSKKVVPLAKEYNCAPEYLLALISLETSGFIPPGSRYEKGVYRRLLAIKEGDRKSYEHVKKRHVQELGDEGLRNLATSWGPFQIMGYKCVAMGVNVHDLRGEASLENGLKWIKDEYGKHLRKKQFKHAFHIHNTGHKYPRNGNSRTHDPKYVDRGLSYMRYFKQRLQSEG